MFEQARKKAEKLLIAKEQHPVGSIRWLGSTEVVVLSHYGDVWGPGEETTIVVGYACASRFEKIEVPVEALRPKYVGGLA